MFPLFYFFPLPRNPIIKPRIGSVIKPTSCFFPSGPQAACVSGAPWSNKEVPFTLLPEESHSVLKAYQSHLSWKRINLKDWSEPSMMKHQAVLYSQTVGTAVPDQTREFFPNSSLSNALLRSWRKPLVYGKQFQMSAKAQKPYFIWSAANRKIPPKTLSRNRD